MRVLTVHTYYVHLDSSFKVKNDHTIILTSILSESMIVLRRWAMVITVHSVNFLRIAC